MHSLPRGHREVDWDMNHLRFGRGRGVQSVSPLSSLAWDPNVVVARVLDPLTHPGPLGEGQTTCDVTEY